MEDDEFQRVIEPYELSYSDILHLSSNADVLHSLAERKKLESVRRSVMEALGPDGPGLLCVTGVPNGSAIRQKLLPFARKLALLDGGRRKHILQEQCLGSDVPMKDPRRSVSSFAMQLSYAEALLNSRMEGNYELREKCNLDLDNVYNHLGSTFKELGFLMMNLGMCLARICDQVIGGHELEQSLMESCSAKGRLIHYHSQTENLILKKGGKSGKKTDSTKHEANSNDKGSNLWQQWHYDYGIFTVLTAPMFLLSDIEQEAVDQDFLSCVQECPYPDGHTDLQILDPRKNAVFTVKASPESFIIQVGESADILSKGKLRAPLHSVCRPINHDNMSRETFVLFLQPSWSKTFSLADYPIQQLTVQNHCNGKLMDISKVVPPLTSRLKDGMSFAEFARETTKQYYGGSGLQSNG